MTTLPGEIITQLTADRHIEQSSAVWAFMYGLDPVQRMRFYQLAHELVFIGYKAMEERSTRAAVEFDKERQAERKLSHEAAVYAMGVRDHIHLMDEGEI